MDTFIPAVELRFDDAKAGPYTTVRNMRLVHIPTNEQVSMDYKYPMTSQSAKHRLIGLMQERLSSMGYFHNRASSRQPVTNHYMQPRTKQPHALRMESQLCFDETSEIFEIALSQIKDGVSKFDTHLKQVLDFKKFKVKIVEFEDICWASSKAICIVKGDKKAWVAKSIIADANLLRGDGLMSITIFADAAISWFSKSDGKRLNH